MSDDLRAVQRPFVARAFAFLWLSLPGLSLPGLPFGLVFATFPFLAFPSPFFGPVLADTASGVSGNVGAASTGGEGIDGGASGAVASTTVASMSTAASATARRGLAAPRRLVVVPVFGARRVADAAGRTGSEPSESEVLFPKVVNGSASLGKRPVRVS